MIHHVVIKPATTNDQMLPTIYTDKKSGKTRYMPSEFEYDEIHPTDKDYATKIATALTYTLSRKNKPTLEYKFETDSEGKGVTPRDTKIEMLCMLYWAQHPQFTMNGDASKNLNFTVPNFDILFVQDENKNLRKKFKQKLDIVNRIIGMSFEDRRNVAYYFGHTPKSLTEDELTYFLAEFSTGLIFKFDKAKGIDNSKQFLDVWMKETDSERDYIVNTQKAINLGIFRSTSENGRTTYTYEQQFIGTAFNDVLAFCKREDRLYNDRILREIKVSDEKEIKIADAEKKAKPSKVAKKAEAISATPASSLENNKIQETSFGEMAKSAGIA